MGFMLMPVRKPARTSNIFSRQVSAQAVHADNLRAVKVRSAEATELPVWERPPVSVANGLCHPLGTGSRVAARDDTFLVWCVLFRAGWLVSKDWITGQVTPPHPTNPLRALARTPTARDDTVDSLLDLFQLTIPPSNICANLREPPFQLQISC